MMKISSILFLIILISLTSCNNKKWSITSNNKQISIKAGVLERNIEFSEKSAATISLQIDGKNILSEGAGEFSVALWKASPNAEPQGIAYSDEAGVSQEDAVKNQTDALNVEKKSKQSWQTTEWVDSIRVSGKETGAVFDSVGYSVLSPEAGKNRLIISFISSEKTAWEGISAEIVYEIDDGYPAIRKWIRFSNQGKQWIKINNLVIDDIAVKAPYTSPTLMAPAMRGIGSSIIAFSDSAASSGIISVSEIPSILHNISETGASGYNPAYFEWVLGPSESFESEPVFLYGFSGESYPTASAVSTALDRCAEGEFKTFLNKKILRPALAKEIAPVFCTWTNYNSQINDANMREAADIASQIGFRCFQLDAGWSKSGPKGGWAVSTTSPDTAKFPDLKALSQYIRSKGMETGLWYSVFIDENLADPNSPEPGLFSLPLIRRGGGLGLSFCFEKSREKYSDEITYLNKTYEADYFKQDLSNVCYGDIARGHESRTLKESYLRGLRGLFATEDRIHNQAPEAWLQLSHEIYWETPGPEGDVAVLKHVDSYHAAPNEYWGAGNRSKRVSPDWNFKADSLQKKLIQGAFRSRDLMYAHRGLPLERIEVFGAVTTNFNGSLTPEIQDRQICSWLMGAPLSYSGDLSSLTEENIQRYQSRFAMLDRLQKEYGIYSCFQFSGVPAPTDEGWHWWGKLNSEGYGAVVALRGKTGEESRNINIPWVQPGKKYRLTALFSGKDLGTFSGKQLIGGELKLALPPLGQEIIEISAK